MSVARALAARAKCELGLAKAALTRVDDGDVEAAYSLLTEGPKEAYIGLGEEEHQTHGDSVFQHPYVQCLLDVARAQVQKALEVQREPDEEKWLICVRTYGRAGVRALQSELCRFVDALLKPKDASILKDNLAKIGVDDLAAFKVLLNSDSDLNQRLREKGLSLLQKKTLLKLREHASKPLEQIEKKQKLGESGLRELTLAVVEKALGPKAHERCLIFVSHEDPAFKLGHYTTVLAGTPWADRIVQGVKGAQLQVRFMEEAAPKGTHIVVMDDNIIELIVEEGDVEAIEKEKAAGNHLHMRRPLVYGEVKDPLQPTGLAVVEEPELRRFLRAAWDRWKERDLDQIESTLGLAGVTTLFGFRRKLQADLVTCDLLGIRVLPKLKHALTAQLEKPLPPPLMLARPSKKRSLLAVGKSELAQLIVRAGKEMTNQGVSLWGINPTQNHFFLKGAGDSVRYKAKKLGVFKDYNSKLGLIYGACFGFRVLHDRRLYTRFGQVKDDVERTLRYWHFAGGTLRFGRYGADKRAFNPGKFVAKKGGISAASSAQRHEEEGRKALQGMMDEFASPYVRFPRPGEKSSVGLVWKSDAAEDGGKNGDEDTDGVDPNAVGVSESDVAKKKRPLATPLRSLDVGNKKRKTTLSADS